MCSIKNRLLSAPITNAQKRNKLAQLAQMPTFVPVLRSRAGARVGMCHLIDGGRQVTERAYGQAKCVISPVLLFERKALSFPWLALPGICRLRF